jgi:hypothetical protein
MLSMAFCISADWLFPVPGRMPKSAARYTLTAAEAVIAKAFKATASHNFKIPGLFMSV